MRPTLFVVSLVLAVAVITSPRVAQAEPTKALRYHKALLRRPAPGYVFDRFFNAWVEEESVESLAEFLEGRAADSAGDGLLLAFFHAKQGDDLRAIEQFRKTLASEPGNATAWHQKAIIEARSLDFETALADLAKAQEAEPDEELATRIATLRARLLVRSGDREAALKAFEALIAERPRDEELVEDVIELQVDEGLYDQAAALATKLAEQTKDPYKKLLRKMRLAGIRQQAGLREKAIEIYVQTLADAGAESWLEREILAQIERVYRREEDLGGLKRRYAALAEAYPKRVAVLRGRARVLADGGDGQEAIEQFRKVLAVTPGDRDNQQEFVKLHLQIEDFAGARKQLEKLIELYPKDTELSLQLAEVAAKLKDSATVVASVDGYLEKSDGSEYAHLRAARLLDRLKEADAAKDKYELLTTTFPESRSAKESRAAFLYKAGEKEQAVSLWEAAAEGGDSQQVVRVAKMLGSRQEHEAAYGLLQQQSENLGRDPLYLAQLVDAALALKKYEEAIPFALRRVDLAEKSPELDPAVSQAVKAISRAEQVLRRMEELAGLESPSTQQVCLLAELIDHNGDAGRADETLAPLLEAGDPLAVMQQIRLARRRRDWDTAVLAAERALDLPSGRNSRNLRQLIEFYERSYRPEEALKRLTEWKRLSPGSSTPWLTEARLLQSEGKTTAAIETLRLACRRLDDPRDVRSRLAQLYTLDGKLADAERLYWVDYEESEDLLAKIRAVEQLARVAESSGKTPALIANFEQRRREYRTSIEPLMALAAIHRVAQNYDKRIQVLGEAAKMRPDDLQLLSQVARIQEKEGDWEAARDTLRRAVSVDKTTRSKGQLARLLIRWGESDEGYNLLNELATAKTDDPRELEKLADAMIAVGDWDRAAEFLQSVIDKQSGDFRLRYLFAVCQEENDALIESTEGFLAVLTAEEEVQLGAPASNANSMNWYSNELRRIAPAGMVDLITSSQSVYQAYSHQQNRGGIRFVQGGGAASAISMPSSAEQARSFALAHLSRIAATLDEEQSSEIREAVLAIGGEEADSAFLLSKSSPTMGRQVDFESLGDAAERPEVLAFLAMRGRGVPGMPDGLLAKAVEEFRDSHPEIALIAALNGIRDGSEEDDETSSQADLAEQAKRLLSGIDKPSAVTMVQVCQWRSSLGRRQAVEAPEELKDLIQDRLLRWYPGPAAKQAQYGPWIMMQVASVLRESDDPKPYFEFLQAEVERHAKNPQAARSQPNFYGRQPSRLLSPPTFPPAKLRGVPQNLVRLVVPGNQQSGFNFGANPSQAEWEPETIKSALEVVKDPTLRLLLLHSIDDEAGVRDGIKKLLGAERPSLDAYLLAAGWACEEEKPSEAVGLLSKARFLPMNRQERRALDGALVALVQELSEESADSKPDESLLLIGREAALRLRHGRLDAGLRSELATALSEFGLEKEAERLERVAVASTTSQSYPMNFRSTQRASTDQIAKLIEAGKQDAAARRLAQEMRGYVAQYQQQTYNRDNARRQAQQLKGRLAGYGLLEKMIESLDPGESKSHRKLGEFAIALDLLGEDERAVGVYERAVASRPKHDATRVLLMIALANAGRQEEIPEHLDRLGKQGPALLSQEIAAVVHDYQMPIKRRLDMIEVACLTLEHQVEQGGAKADASWSSSVLQQVANQMHSNNNGWLPSLYAKQSRTRRQQSKEQTTRRAKLHERFCEAMLQCDATACDAFAGLLAAHEASAAQREGEAKDNEESESESRDFEAIARNAVIRHSPARQNAHQHQGVRYNNVDDVRLISPAEYLIRRSAKRNDWSKLDDEILPAVKHASSRDALKGLRELYACDEQGFAAAAEAFIKRSRRRPPFAPGGANTPEVVVLECNDRRGSKTDLAPLFNKLLKAHASGNSNLPNWCLRYASHLSKHQGATDAASWIERIADEMLGPSQRRAKHIAKHYTNNGWSHNSPNGRMHMFEQFLQRAAQRPELLLPIVCFLPTSEIGPLASDALRYLEQGSMLADLGDAEEVVTLLDQSGLLGTAGELPLTPISTGVTGSGRDISEILAAQMRRMKKPLREEVRKTLSEREPQTLGLALVIDGLSETKDRNTKQKNRVCQQALATIDQLKALDAPQNYRVAIKIAGATAPIRNRGNPDDELASLFAWVDSQQDGGNQQIVERFNKIKRFSELGVESHRLDEWCVETLAPIASVDPDAAAAVFMRVCDLHDDAVRAGRMHSHYSNGMANHIVSQMPWRWRQLKEGDAVTPLRFMLALARRPEGGRVSMSRNNFYQFTNQVQQAIDPNRNNRSEWAKKTHGWIVREFGEEFSPLLSLVYQEQLQHQFGKSRLKDVIAWLAEEAPRDTSVKKAVADDMLAWARLAMRGYDSGYDPSEAYAYFDSLLRDDSQPLPTRLSVACRLKQQRRGKQELPLTLRQAVSDTAADACRAGVQFDYDYSNVFCRNLYELLRDNPADASAVACCDAFQKRFVTTRPRPRNHSGGSSSNDLHSTNALLEFTACWLLRDKPEEAKRVARRYESYLKSRHEVIAMLTRHGFIDDAARLARSGWTKLPLRTTSIEAAHYDRRLEEALPRLKEKLSGPLAYVMEAALARLPDAKKGSAEPPEVDRKTRLVSVAKRFDEAGLATPQMIETAILMLRDSQEAIDLVGEQLQGAASRRKIVSVPNQHSPDLEKIAELHKLHARWALRQSDPAPALAFLDTVAIADRNSNWQLYNQYRRHSGELWDEMYRQLPRFKEEQIEQIADQSLRLMARDDVDGDSRYDKLHRLSVFVHAKVARTKEFEKAAAGMKNQAKRSLKRSRPQGIDWKLVAGAEPGDQATLDQRIERLADFLTLASASDWILIESSWIRHEEPRDRDLTMWQAFFTTEEIAAAAPAVAERSRGKNKVHYHALAGLALDKAGEHLLAATQWEKTRALARKDNKPGYAAKRAESLLNGGEAAAALALFKNDFESEEQPNWAKGVYKRVAKKLRSYEESQRSDTPAEDADTPEASQSSPETSEPSSVEVPAAA